MKGETAKIVCQRSSGRRAGPFLPYPPDTHQNVRVCLQCAIGFVHLFFCAELVNQPISPPAFRSISVSHVFHSNLSFGNLPPFGTARTESEIFRHLLYHTEYFIFKSKFCFNLSKSSHSSLCVLNLALNYFQATHIQHNFQSQAIFSLILWGWRCRNRTFSDEFRVDWTDINYVERKRRENSGSSYINKSMQHAAKATEKRTKKK